MGTQSLYEDEHFKIANAVYPGRWGTSKNYYTRCAAFRRESQKIEVTSGPYRGDSLWRAIEKAFMEFGDFTNMDPKLVKNVVLSADALVKVRRPTQMGCHGPRARPSRTPCILAQSLLGLAAVGIYVFFTKT
eukprot:7410368-Pyramimonas_sp.AAC.1